MAAGNDDENKDYVNQFFGWAIFLLTKRLQQDYFENKVQVMLLDSMRIYHHKALLDEEYMSKCYSFSSNN